MGSIGWFKKAIGLLNGFRKYSVQVLILMIGTYFRVAGYLTGQEFVDLIVPISVAFMTMNGLEWAGKTVMKWVDEKYGDDDD